MPASPSLCWLPLLLLGFACPPQGVCGCLVGEPQNCTFQDSGGPAVNVTPTFCSWIPDAGFDLAHFQGYPNHRFAGLKDGSTYGTLRSRQSCSTQEMTFCLTFLFGFTVNNTVTLGVKIVPDGVSDADSPAVWTTSGSDGWGYGQVPVETNTGFTLVFTAARRQHPRPPQPHTVFLDDVRFIRAPCATHPPTAAPTRAPGGDGYGGGDAGGGSSGDDQGLIVGVVVAVVLVVVVLVGVVVVVLVVLHRQGKLGRVKYWCWRKKASVKRGIGNKF